MKKLIPVIIAFSIFNFQFSISVLGQQPTTPAIEKSEVIQTIDDVSYYMHTVKQQQTLYSLSRFYEVTIDQIRQDNPAIEQRGLQAEMVIRIRVSNQQPVISSEVEDVIVPDKTTIQSYSEAESPVITDDAQLDLVLADIEAVEQDCDSIAIDIVKERRQIREIALMLPLTDDGKEAQNSANLIALYQGVLIAMQEYDAIGVSLNLSLYDTGKSPEKVAEILESDDFITPDLIIGPIYDPQIAQVIDYAASEGIDIVSPLATTTENFGENFFQMAPDESVRFEKLRELFSGDKNIVIITTDENDDDMEAAIKATLDTIPYKKIVWDRRTSGIAKIRESFSSSKDNIFIITSGNEMGVDMILAQLSSHQNRRSNRGYDAESIAVVGSPKWLRYENMDKTLMFKLNVCFSTPHYGDYSPAMQNFTSRYINAFGRLPNQYSERGYDAVRRFVEPVEPLNNYQFEPLNGNSTNTNWSIVSYTSDFNIEVK